MLNHFRFVSHPTATRYGLTYVSLRDQKRTIQDTDFEQFQISGFCKFTVQTVPRLIYLTHCSA